jgi:hypothetical protein
LTGKTLRGWVHRRELADTERETIAKGIAPCTCCFDFRSSLRWEYPQRF